MATGLVITDLVLRKQGADAQRLGLAAPLALTGLGMGMIFMPMFDVVLAGVEPHQLGSASGLLESIQQLGMSIGIAVVGTVLFDVVGSAHGPGRVRRRRRPRAAGLRRPPGRRGAHRRVAAPPRAGERSALSLL